MNNNFRVFFFGITTIFLAILLLEGFRWVLGGAFFGKGMITRWVFMSITLVLAYYLQSKRSFLTILMIVTLTIVIYLLTSSTLAAWILISLYFIILIWIAQRLTTGRILLVRLAIYISIALFAGITTLALEQVQTRFSEEEFYAALQALLLVLIWGLLAFSVNLWIRLTKNQIGTVPTKSLAYFLIGLTILVITGSFIVIKTYQSSFYPKRVPSYSGISYSSPFLCGEIREDQSNDYLGESVYEQILELVEANPNKKSPEFGMLALGYKTPEWKKLFHESILEEARQRLYTQPNNSVKFSQHEAALRVYYYSRVSEEFPDLFSPSEVDEIKAWFRAINQRAQTVEWVDWMYAIAYNKKPEGPYENQEIGAGLLALLESEDLADPALSEINRSYLDENPRGWDIRFRNTDDAAVYQPEWINNALFQSHYTSDLNLDNVNKSIQWLLMQSLPDGSPLRYNHISATKIADTAYQGSSLLDNQTALWFAGKSVDYLKSKGGFLSAVPGVEAPALYPGTSPEWGSCLLYGDSGLPNQIGPLAPDKLVFRDGWTEEAMYMLVNLRFTGWHRYKASNTITMLYQGGPLVNESKETQSLGWLPVGRSLFRDKRIPRENLNGLIIEKMGLSAVIHKITGIGSPWAQDPPFYAIVKEFETSEEIDYSHTVIENWHGWNHSRQIFFYHDGPIVVVDEAVGKIRHNAAITWHVIGQVQDNGERFTLTGGSKPSEMLLISTDSNIADISVLPYGNESDNLEVQYTSQNSGVLTLITIFLKDDWLGAEGRISDDPGYPVLSITKDEKKILIPLESHS